MAEYDTIQIKSPYKFDNKEDFLQAQSVMKKALDKFFEYTKFCKKSENLKEKTNIKNEKDLESFLSDK